MTAAEPLRRRGGVLPEWIDYNEHVMDGYYLVAFTDSTDACLEILGFGPAYRARTGCSVHTVETHVNFLREARLGDELDYETLLLGADAKRLRMFHTMSRTATGEVLATNELMLLHVDLALGGVSPMPVESLDLAQSMAAAHSSLGWPANAGRAISMEPRRHGGDGSSPAGGSGRGGDHSKPAR
ncbi:MAG TPA: thioesterase family protein [Acidimicrobiales bacterium]|nr:thioesterase family protein [Acidimicrobiales bacterium]